MSGTGTYNVNELLAVLRPMSVEQLREASRVLRQVHSDKQAEALIESDLSVGDSVEFMGKHGNRLRGTVWQLNRKSVEVRVATFGGTAIRYRVSPSLLTRVQGAA